MFQHEPIQHPGGRSAVLPGSALGTAGRPRGRTGAARRHGGALVDATVGAAAAGAAAPGVRAATGQVGAALAAERGGHVPLDGGQTGLLPSRGEPHAALHAAERWQGVAVRGAAPAEQVAGGARLLLPAAGGGQGPDLAAPVLVAIARLLQVAAPAAVLLAVQLEGAAAGVRDVQVAAGGCC